ncbi:MAG: hypothetical protein J6Q94_08580 [Clostridia bacterium]|nr:hypothetical protein [Clostridia bacterium]
MKKYIAILVTVFLLSSITACNKKDDKPATENTTVNTITDTNIQESVSFTSAITPDINTTTTAANETITLTDNNKNDASLMSASEIVDLYKKAASKSDSSIKSVQNISLNDIKINDGTGMANSVIKMIKPIISTVVSGNSTEFDGITGGYTQLSVNDVQEASASANGDNIVVELKMKDQTDKGQMAEADGSVGHAIFVIGDLSTVMGQLSDSGLPVEIQNENISATYVDAVVNVTIDEDGNIINGTWKYIVTIGLENFKVAGSTVDRTEVTIENIITYNGGIA